MNSIKIFSGSRVEDLQSQIEEWTTAMKKDHPAAFKIASISLSVSNAMSKDIYLAVIYKC